MKYSDQLADWLVTLGYTHCFYVAGGNIMHLLESCSRRMTCIPVVHEVAAGIAAEYFTECDGNQKAFALVTAGPGLTNIITAMAGAYLESRELLVLGGQVKTADLAHGVLRQRGIQEIAGVDIAAPVTVASILMTETLDGDAFASLLQRGWSGRSGPVFIEIPLDIQGRDIDPASIGRKHAERAQPVIGEVSLAVLEEIGAHVQAASRPIILIGGGVDRKTAGVVQDQLVARGVPLMTTWNGADRVPVTHPLFFGRPNTWGQRSANLLLQQADLLIVLGSRLGLQQTGFNWQQFALSGRVIQVECDPAELEKGHPRVDYPICGDANQVLRYLATSDLGKHDEWIAYCREVRVIVADHEPKNQTAEQYVSPYEFCSKLSELCGNNDVVIPCSSGGAFTVMMQGFEQKPGQVIITNKGLASMGYGLSGAIGAAIAAGGRRTILVEGDGGFSQNLQEVGTVAINNLNLKMFIFDDGGYASIRMTQRSYFGGRYIGCDRTSGLGLPKWETFFAAYDVPTFSVGPDFERDPEFRALFDAARPVAFLVRIDPQQTYFPKITSRITETGSMESNPLHLMSPDLGEEIMKRVGRYLTEESL
jgi:acetolactate synthase-1/2/3 large subunit